MNNENIGWLTTVPASDENFKSALKKATADELRTALMETFDKPFSKTKVQALKRELRKRGEEII